jgi:AMMECR1 domain-containing protein
VLHTFEKAKDWNDWEIGKHGISISFSVGKKRFHGTYLPYVASEQSE